MSATDEDGNSVPYSDNRITTHGSSIDTSKPGEHEIKYSYKGISKTSDSTFKVTVKEDKTKLELQDVSLYVGQNYDIDSPFKNVTDKDGNPIKASNIDWYYIDEVKTKTLDTSKPGVHKVRIVYLDGANQWKYSDSCTVNVKEDKSSIKTKDSNLIVGEDWDKENNFVSATDEDDNAVPYSDNRITTNGSSIDTSHEGFYKVTYSYKGKVKTIDSTFKVAVESGTSKIYEYGDQQTKIIGDSLAKGIEKSLKIQSSKIGYLTNDDLSLPNLEYTPEITIPESAPVQLSDNIRIYGKTTFQYAYSGSQLFFLILGYDNSKIERTKNIDLSDNQGFNIQAKCDYTVEQKNPKTQEWNQIKVPYVSYRSSYVKFNFKGYYEIAPKLNIEEKHESVEVVQGSTFNFKPEEFFTEKSSAGGTRAKFIKIPDLSILGEQTAKIRVWDQYVTAFGWDNIDDITDGQWASGEWPLNPSHYTTFDVKFNIVPKSDQGYHKLGDKLSSNSKS